MGRVTKKGSTANMQSGENIGSPTKLRHRKPIDNGSTAAAKGDYDENDGDDGQGKGAGIVPQEDTKKKWRNWRQRTTFTFLMIAGFFTVIALGPL
ncbi:hypothetical protein GGH99_008871, partial [Coemansia sp. RSA 1285]